METVDSIYGAKFFSRRNRLAWRAPIICGSIVKFLDPKTAIDVGCAIGDLVDGFLKMEVNACGLEGADGAFGFLMCSQNRIMKHDLRIPIGSVPIEFPTNFDVVTCFEVAEHIEMEYADIFIQTLQALARRWIVMSAAQPGQGGRHHVNCQLPNYWISKFVGNSFWHTPDIERKLKKEWEPWRKRDGIRAFYDNLLVFERGNHEPSSSL